MNIFLNHIDRAYNRLRQCDNALNKQRIEESWYKSSETNNMKPDWFSQHQPTISLLQRNQRDKTRQNKTRRDETRQDKKSTQEEAIETVETNIL